MKNIWGLFWILTIVVGLINPYTTMLCAGIFMFTFVNLILIIIGVLGKPHRSDNNMVGSIAKMHTYLFWPWAGFNIITFLVVSVMAVMLTVRSELIVNFHLIDVSRPIQIIALIVFIVFYAMFTVSIISKLHDVFWKDRKSASLTQ